MRALQSYHRWFKKRFGFLHKQRFDALMRAVMALFSGSKLTLSSLGRGLNAEPKYGIKSVDRLLGNKSLHRARKQIYAALAAEFVGDRPIVLVDVTEIRVDVCEMTASLAVEGRALPIASMVKSKRVIMTRRSRKEFLNQLAVILPEGSVPIIVTDAGFQGTWLDAVRENGWDYVGRLRHRTRIYYRGKWISPQEAHQYAGGRARSLGRLDVRRYSAAPRRIILGRRRHQGRKRGRQRKTSRGARGRHNTDKRCEQSAREPWLLATSLKATPKNVVAIYKMRMQIEQNYRDKKNSRWGFGLSETRSRTHRRLEMLSLIGALAMALTLVIGCAAECRGLHRLQQANTVKHKRVISWFMLGLAMIRRGRENIRSLIRDGTAELRNRIQALERHT